MAMLELADAELTQKNYLKLWFPKSVEAAL
jgi:hypothetical protein